jgi:hypothetical protein
MNIYESVIPENPIGKTISILGEVCSSWGYSVRKKAIAEIAKALAKEGYEVRYTVQPVHGSTGIIRLTLIKDDGSKIVVFSNREGDKVEGAIHGLNLNTKEKEIVEKIKSLLEGKEESNIQGIFGEKVAEKTGEKKNINL